MPEKVPENIPGSCCMKESMYAFSSADFEFFGFLAEMPGRLLFVLDDSADFSEIFEAFLCLELFEVAWGRAALGTHVPLVATWWG